MTKQETYDFLNAKNIEYEITEHKAVFSMDEICNVVLPYPECDAKNLFVRDDKKREYFLITVKGNKRVDLKEFRKTHGTRSLSFASAEDLMNFLKLTPGSVTPLGLLNGAGHKVKFFLDKDFLEPPGLIGIHPNENTATVWLKTADLVRLIEENGNEIELAEL